MSGYNVQKLCNDTLRVEGIKQLDYIFPRDSKTKSFVNKILQNNFVTDVVDPTLLLFNWMQYASNFNTPKNYLLFYGYSPSQNVISFIKKFSKENNMRILKETHLLTILKFSCFLQELRANLASNEALSAIWRICFPT